MRQTAFYRAINDSVPFSSSKLIIYLIFLVYIISGHGELTADKVYCIFILKSNDKKLNFFYIFKFRFS